MSPRRTLPPLSLKKQKQRTVDRLIDMLLMGIISENPYHKEGITNEVRLARAREALLGEKIKPGRKSELNQVRMFPVYDEAC